MPLTDSFTHYEISKIAENAMKFGTNLPLGSWVKNTANSTIKIKMNP